MSIYTKILKDYAVYWPPLGLDENGRFATGTAVEIRCRWEENCLEFLDGHGQISVSKSKIFSGIDLAFGGMIWHGRLANVVSATVPTNNPGALEIRGWKKIPNRKNTRFLRIAFL